MPARLLHLALPCAMLALVACGGRDPLPSLTDASTCADAQEVVEVALEEGRLYIGTDRDDPVLADEIIFALSAVDERPECFTDDDIAAARGLRATVNDALEGS